ncbi:MAG TPA: 23S rRNA pseudouridine(1911/1915/1917) synthase RluD [Halothiobacillus sp.]|nr:23S rRNA pseudouridine(1911/1915/1917) synthase RluD [Halothiobacillus sp.]
MKIQKTVQIPLEAAGQRLDQALSSLWPDYSRNRIQAWIRDGRITVNGVTMKPRSKVLGGETVVLDAEEADKVEDQAQAIELNIVYEDEHLIVINKPAGMVVHPAAGNPDGTLLNALLHHDPMLRSLPRAGIVHRLDKDTSGLLVVARTSLAQNRLIEQLAARTVSREYDAVVNGVLIAGATIDAPIGRHPRDRQRQAVVQGGREAITHYRVVKRYAAHSWLRVKLATGRTHQIRVHMAHIRHPLVGDATYGGRPKLPKGADDMLINILRHFRRQALHARKLGLIHPVSGELMSWEAPLPDDMKALIKALDDHARSEDEDGEVEVIYVRE